jgi:predicted CXXCH cytochrome family protein
MKRTYVILLIAMIVVLTVSAQAQYSRIKNIVGSNHDMSSTNATAALHAVSNKQICYYCHSPHPDQANNDPAVTTAPNGQTPLWNHYLSSKASYGVYSSPSFDPFGTDIADLGGAVAGSAAVSNLCLSCHDGTVGVNTLYKGQYTGNAPTHRDSPDFGGGLNVAVMIPGSSGAVIGGGTAGLSDMHPLNFTYDATLAGKSVSLVVPTTASNGFGGTRTGVNTSSGKFLPLFADKMQCATCHDVHDGTTNRPFLRASTNGSELCLGCHGK